MADGNILTDFGINLLEEEIDDVIFQTNEFLTDATFTGSQGPCLLYTSHASIPNPSNQAAVEDIKRVQEVIARESKQLVYSHFNLIVAVSGDTDLDVYKRQ